MGFEMTFYHEDGRESIFDDKENEANQYDEIPSLCLKKITDLRKMVKNDIYFASQLAEEPDANMTEVSLSCNLVRTSATEVDKVRVGVEGSSVETIKSEVTGLYERYYS
ncbi:hypothetical protein G6F29_001249 [Rhizopus arrhizus]|uniref:Uncharacterized protein n=1 Tax=Rhizopus oryzae TaxID=64495 RepID=A0A9P7BX58_RHIOR|nr:hypothetical protein G6F24_004197 [Rhizopus arrhizus]KAG1416123.1 hypothetical protein G6F58_006126 [Rhizopus delemar]KAG0792638.1 hypothetical protein G6F21_004207 [Rhizopus arrhizus]KAG0869327.1 hypothetical protein G6F16_007388 [Rhizopus arrhizus]KAG0889102.1 hypothetical protein G6F15_000969 [Rhizopus arrhizus]